MKSFANTSRKLLWVSHVSFCPFFSLLLHRFECLNSRVCVCAWFECCSFVADSWNDTNCYHCAPLSLWKLTTTTEKFTIHEVQILDSQYSLKATWRGGEMTLMNDEYKTVLPPPKKTPNFNQCWRCLLSWTHALLLSFYHSNRKCTYWLEFQYIQPGTARGRKEHGS